MLKLENWGDLFKYNKELFDDDYNHGQKLVAKVKCVSSDGTTECTDTYKQATADDEGDSKISFESKCKFNRNNEAHEFSVKQTGEVFYEGKCGCIEEKLKVKGVKFLFNSNVWAVPTDKTPAFRIGFDYAHEKAKLKWIFNLRSWVSETQFTYQVRPCLVFGTNFVLDATAKNLDKYDFGFTWSPADNAFVGLKHESTSKDALQFGKFFLFFQHVASQSQTVGAEFALDWQKKAIAARLGYLHKFNSESSAKVKVNDNAQVDLLLKHKYNSNVTFTVASTFNIRQVVAQSKTSALPIGLGFDIKC
jgi:hypothetical protein